MPLDTDAFSKSTSCLKSHDNSGQPLTLNQAILAVEHQRLVKYPLLLEQLAKQTPLQQQQPQAVSEDGSGGAASEVVVATSASPEAAVIKRCVDRSREILECIDQQVADVQNKQKLAEIQGNIDTSGLERMPDHPITAEYRVRDGF